MNFRHLKLGDVIVRAWEYKETLPLIRDSGRVIEVTETIVVCKVQFDHLDRTMIFDIETGININGRDYGWLEGGE